MNNDQRILHGATDVSVALNDFRTGSYVFAYTAGEYLYIGQPMPFNNLWFEVSVANDVASACSVDIWFGNAWVSAVDIIDETKNSSGVSLSTSGRIQWNTNIDKGWDLEQRSTKVTGLSGTHMYNMFWARLSWSNTLKVTTALSYVGQKFSIDDVLFSHYPDLSQAALLEGFETGKTTWNEQHFMAAEHIERDLKKRSLILARGQIVDASVFVDASCHKVAEIVYASFGEPYVNQKSAARKAYNEEMDTRYLKLDQSGNGSLDRDEEFRQQGWLNR